jgi:hypothetical protein
MYISSPGGVIFEWLNYTIGADILPGLFSIFRHDFMASGRKTQSAPLEKTPMLRHPL